MQFVSYHTVYHKVYARYMQISKRKTLPVWKDKFNHWFRRHATRHISWSPQMLKIATTQLLGQHITPETLEAVHRTEVLFRLSVSWRLRRLQRRILQFLWRPHGPMYARTLRSMRASLSEGGRSSLLSSPGA